eukprot:710934-Alexandrium_andersonii.AAC.1
MPGLALSAAWSQSIGFPHLSFGACFVVSVLLLSTQYAALPRARLRPGGTAAACSARRARPLRAPP